MMGTPGRHTALGAGIRERGPKSMLISLFYGTDSAACQALVATPLENSNNHTILCSSTGVCAMLFVPINYVRPQDGSLHAIRNVFDRGHVHSLEYRSLAYLCRSLLNFRAINRQSP
jgi:hypothetical protein